METRRNFFKSFLGFLGAAIVVLKSGSSHAKKLALKLDKVPALKNVGGSVGVKLSGKDVLLIRDSSSSVKGLSMLCTHQNCPVNYNAKSRKVECSCHGSKFELSGKVLGGPATESLPAYPTRLDKDRIIITVK